MICRVVVLYSFLNNPSIFSCCSFRAHFNRSIFHNNLTNCCQKREIYVWKKCRGARLKELKCSRFCLIGLELVQRKLGISLHSILDTTRHDKTDKQRGRRHTGQNSAAKSSQLSLAEQYQKCVQYDSSQFTHRNGKLRHFKYEEEPNCS